MNTIRKANVVYLYLIRNGYSEAADLIRLMYIHSSNRKQLVNWFNNEESINSLLAK